MSIFILVIIFFILIVRFVSKNDKEYRNSDAAKWANDFQRQCQQDTEEYFARKRQKEELLNQARTLESQSRYGTGYERKELKKQAKELKRQAGRL